MNTTCNQIFTICYTYSDKGLSLIILDIKDTLLSITKCCLTTLPNHNSVNRYYHNYIHLHFYDLTMFFISINTNSFTKIITVTGQFNKLYITIQINRNYFTNTFIMIIIIYKITIIKISIIKVTLLNILPLLRLTRLPVSPNKQLKTSLRTQTLNEQRRIVPNFTLHIILQERLLTALRISLSSGWGSVNDLRNKKTQCLIIYMIYHV